MWDLHHRSALRLGDVLLMKNQDKQVSGDRQQLDMKTYCSRQDPVEFYLNGLSSIFFIPIQNQK